MTKMQELPTCNIRIPKQTHEMIRLKCKKEGWLMGAYVDKILNKAISKDGMKETIIKVSDACDKG